VIKGLVTFLKTTPTLSPTEIGKFIGEKKDFNEEVLSWYIEEFNWANDETDLIDAMKELMTGFRIPGEGQIVDRILERFGEKISKDQPDMFGNSEGVFLFSYAVLMVQTSIHNPQAKKCRMSLQDFKKITSTVKLSNTKEIDMDEYRAKIYERVEREPFTLEEDEEARMKLEAQTNTNKKQLFDKEREYIMRRGKNILKKNTTLSDKNQFVLIKDTSTIKPMFE
jgi:brefeldin A-inhibited guanine nucleotide-exchange protein